MCHLQTLKSDLKISSALKLRKLKVSSALKKCLYLTVNACKQMRVNKCLKIQCGVVKGDIRVRQSKPTLKNDHHNNKSKV